jgi:hypothetical protein
MTEIFDVTNNDAEGFQSQSEREANKQLEFDNEWADEQINLCDNGNINLFLRCIFDI